MVTLNDYLFASGLLFAIGFAGVLLRRNCFQNTNSIYAGGLPPQISGKTERCRRPTYQGDESPPSHSMTSSARASSAGGTVRPRAFAVFRLTTNSNFVG